MGPRSCERGNLTTMVLARLEARCFNGAALVRARKSRFTGQAIKGLASLQWGRARASAEIRSAQTLMTYQSCFNGAALVRARKFGVDFPPGTHILTASMGPRSCERGNGQVVNSWG